jgi:hypothetical protein
MLGFMGVTPIDTRVAAVTARVVDPDTLPRVAVIVVVPGLTAVASPALLMEAMAALADFQATCDEMFHFEPSENKPVAVN